MRKIVEVKLNYESFWKAFLPIFSSVDERFAYIHLNFYLRYTRVVVFVQFV